jgi:hypothetical protein
MFLHLVILMFFKVIFAQKTKIQALKHSVFPTTTYSATPVSYSCKCFITLAPG